MVKNNWLSKRLLAVVIGLASFDSFSNPVQLDSIVTAAKILGYSQQAEGSILAETGAADLNIIKGKRAGDITLFSKVNRTHTKFGAETLKHLLVNPLNDVAQIQARQAFVRKLKENAELLKVIDSNISVIKNNEQNLLKFWSDSHKLDSDFLSLSTQLVGAHNSPFLTEFTRAGSFAAIGVLGAVGAVGSLWYLSKFFGVAHSRLAGIKISMPSEEGSQTGLSYQPKKASFLKEEAAALIGSLMIIPAVKYKLIPAFRSQSDISAQMLELLSSVNAILRASKSLDEQLSKIAESAKALQYVQNLKIYTESFEGLSNELTDLIQQLQTSTFVNNKSSVTFAGRIRVAYKRFNELKNNFQALFRAIGEVDAYVSFARLMNEHDDKENKFCFVEYAKVDKSVIEFKNAWCSTLAKDEIVAQSLNLGNKEEGSLSTELYAPNVYLTAANGAGKSTLLILTSHNTILSQVVGIATGTSWKTKIFDAIVTHVNVEHDTTAGQSAYAVEQERMNSLRDDIKRKFNNNKVVLAIVDEPYKSTKESLASTSLESFTKDIEYYDKCICLIASHFLSPAKKIEARNNGRFMNLCIPTRETTTKSGVFIRDHKIVTGIDEWLQEDSDDLGKTDRYDAWLAFTKIDKNA